MKKTLTTFIVMLFVLLMLPFQVTAQTTTVNASADTYVSSSQATTNFGTKTEMQVDLGSPTKYILLRFDAACLPSCTLFVYANNSSSNGPKVYQSGDFNETTVTWNTVPERGNLLGDFSAMSTGWNSVVISTNYSVFRLEADVDNEFRVRSRESGSSPYLAFSGVATNTPLPPTPTVVVPPTNTAVPTATKTNTPLPPTATKTNTPIVVSTPTNTAVVPTATNTPVPTATKTNTPVPATATNTAVVPTNTATAVAGCTETLAAGTNTLQAALNRLDAGEVLCLGAGTHNTSAVKITGKSNVTIKGTLGPNGEIFSLVHNTADDSGRTFELDSVTNSTVKDFAINNGDKGLWLESSSNNSITGMYIYESGGECLRLSGNSNSNYIGYNDIIDCGVHSYGIGGSKNGEAIYIGRDPQQGVGSSDYNVVEYNTLITNGNEGVDIKENSEYNIIRYNYAANQLDPNSGCYDARGDYNEFYGNTAENCAGAGFRTGGDNDGWGRNNYFADNTIINAALYGFKFMVSPQNVVCTNTFINLGTNAPAYYWDDAQGETCGF